MVENECVVSDGQIAVVVALVVVLLADARVATDEPTIPIGKVAVVDPSAFVSADL